MLKRFITCPLCGHGYGSASIDIHIPQCYDKTLKRWRLDPIGPRPVMPLLCKSESPMKNTKFSSDTMFNDKQPCGSGPNAARSLRANLEKGAFSGEGIDLYSCSTCGRRFVFDRIGYHEKVCKRSMRRRVFDSSKQRSAGDTTFGAGNGNISWNRSSRKNKTDTSKSIELSRGQKTSVWRKQHEELIQAIRSAREADAQSRRMWGTKEFAQEPLPVMNSSASSGWRRPCIPASTIRQNATRKSFIACGGRADRGAPNSIRNSPGTVAFQTATHNQNSRKPLPSATSRSDSHRFAVSGGSGSGGIRIANDNSTSLGMLQAFGRA